MTESEQLIQAFDNRARRRDERRDLFRMVVGAAAVGAGAFAFASPAAAQTVTDADILNFALNLEYLEANFYSYAAFGLPIEEYAPGRVGITGVGTPVSASTVTNAAGVRLNAGARKVNFTDPVVAQYAKEIAQDEIAHVAFLRSTLGATSAVAQPAIDVGITPNGAFSSAARAAGFIGATTDAAPTSFDPYASDLNFLYGAFIFEDVGVTAYKGSSALLTNKTYLDAAAGILAAEAYHAAIVRTTIDQLGGGKGLKGATIRDDTELVSGARDSLDGTTDLDQGIAYVSSGAGPTSNIVPTDTNGLAFGRSAAQVLNIVYLNKAQVSAGGFFPAGVNGTIKASANNA
jgi:hypothetical protein